MTPLAFPPPRAVTLSVRHPLFDRELALRCARDADLPGLRTLFASTREEELAAAPWPQATKDAFIGQQFSLQHHHYLSNHPDADFLVLDADGALAGRLYLERTSIEAPAAACDHVIDVSLMPAWRNRGLGEALLLAVRESAGTRGRGVALHVLRMNDHARRLYERLGFEVTGETGAHLEMRWRPVSSRTPPGR